MVSQTARRRRSVRRAVVLECSLRSELWEGELKLPVSNLSTEGLWVDTGLVLEPGHELIVSFKPPRARRHEVVWAAAQVVRAGLYRPHVDSAPKRGVAIAITYCSEEHKRLLARSLLGRPPRLPARAPPPLPSAAQARHERQSSPLVARGD